MTRKALRRETLQDHRRPSPPRTTCRLDRIVSCRAGQIWHSRDGPSHESRQPQSGHISFLVNCKTYKFYKENSFHLQTRHASKYAHNTDLPSVPPVRIYSNSHLRSGAYVTHTNVRDVRLVDACQILNRNIRTPTLLRSVHSIDSPSALDGCT